MVYISRNANVSYQYDIGIEVGLINYDTVD